MRWILSFSLATILIVSGIGGLRFYRSQHFGRADAGIEGALAHSPIDILFIGSSHTYLSYDVAAVERVTGRRAYLIGYNGLQLTSMAPVIRYLVGSAVVKPKQIVVEAYSANLAAAPGITDSRLYFESPPPLKRLIVASYLRQHPGTQGYTDVFDLIVNRGNEQILMYPITSRVSGRNTYHGAGLISASQGVSSERFSKFHAHVSQGVPNAYQLAALQEIIGIGRDSGVQLLFVESPMPAPVSQSRPIQDLKRVFRDNLASARLPYLDGDTVFPINDPALFEDDNHLSGAGRQRFTSVVAQMLVGTKN